MKDTPFTEAQLLSLYDRVAEAEDTIPRLRRFVLDLAVRGKLVEQDAGDEPVAVLLERIKKITQKPTRPQSDDFPFVLPTGWAWSDIGGICTKTGSGSTPRGGKEVYTSDGIPFLRSQNVYDHGLVLNDVAYIAPEVHERMAGTHVLPFDLLLNITGGSMGRCCRVPDMFHGANVSQHVAIIRCAVSQMAEFIHALVRSPYFQGFIFDEQTGAGRGGLPKNRMDRIVVPVPPLEEQHRIVSKVGELMALLDRLEAARAAREETRTRLTAASLSRLTEADNDTPTAARFALQTLPSLTTRPDQIKTLRQTILNLAVCGKLVKQEAGDEPVAKLLASFKAAKSRLKQETGDARIKLAPTPDARDYPAELPAGWGVQSFENLFLFIDYRGNTPAKTEGGVPLITAKNVRMRALNREPREFVSPSTYPRWMTRGFPKPGDLFFTTEAPLANICVNELDEPFALAQRVICFQPYAEIDTHYIAIAVASDVMQKLIDDYATGMTARGIKAANLKPLPIPLPPLAEQHRIVAKVEELMSLCDRLERALQDTTTTRACLLDATLRDALEGEKNPELVP